ncbi:TIGR03943 family putative permease subunit [Enterococcus gilvus]|uniref:TIGR03943 family putative permease subunit n=1 Tax=Enterococcus gilvus TaxID=160453 RepID=UPI003ED993D9
MIRFFIFSGYFEWMAYLVITGQIDKYLNVHYRYLIYLTMLLSLFFSIAQLIIWVRESNKKRSTNKISKYMSNFIVYCLISLPFLTGFALPNIGLDSQIVNTKGFSFPLSKESVGDPYFQTQYLAPDTSMYFNQTIYKKRMLKKLDKYKDLNTIHINDTNYLDVMELIYDFPNSFYNKKITIEGFFYKMNKSEQEYRFIFRFGIVHCIADAGVYGMYTKNISSKHMNNEWLSVSGTVSQEYFAPLKRELPVLNVDKAVKIDKPKSEYVYLNDV